MAQGRETRIERATRHVRENESRIAAQQGLITKLERKGPSRDLDLAHEMLARMHELQRLACEHLELELKKADGEGA